MNQHRSRRPDELDDRSRNRPHERRPHDRFGDNYEPRRPDWREPDREERIHFDSPWDQPRRSQDEDRRRHQEDDDRRRGFSNYGDYAGSDRGRGYGPGRPDAGRADYTRRHDNAPQGRAAGSRSYHPEGTSGYLSDRRADDPAHARRDQGRAPAGQRGYDDARNLPARGDFDRGADRFYENYRDDFASRPERGDDRRQPAGRGAADRPAPRRPYDGSNRDGARSDYGYGDDYSSSLYDPNSRNSALRRPSDADRWEERRQPDQNRRWTDSPDLDNQPRR
ncbi:hypothetical protein [Hymenobacter edaphi]|uniref:Uncharacterized protein n=1 Tax=Hymenobacter edaphi TaxID=2211146 RepID=A0A328BSP8_9BACT|nr:hypothetical protein [Hymenobacter edaphi]RAK69591.1 hypothetical protein DLM85_01650 [Hymenobacter edaphi]